MPRDLTTSFKPYIWLASYPKSGNTWLRLLLAHLLADHDDVISLSEQTPINPLIASDRSLFDETLQLDSSELAPDQIERLRPLVFKSVGAQARVRLYTKTHDSFGRTSSGDWLFPVAVSQAAVYMVRNPLDVAVSYYHYANNKPLDQIVDNLCSATHYIGEDSGDQLRQHLGGWSRHYASWARQREVPVIVIRYEDLLADTFQTLQEIAVFLELPQAQDPARIDSAVRACEFEQLRKQERETLNYGLAGGGVAFFRSGVTGGWRAELGEAQVEKIIRCHAPAMTELGYLDANGAPAC